MRNYIAELREAGLSWAELSQETGKSTRQLRRYLTGEAKLRSGTESYETIRNTSRRVTYNLARESIGSKRAAGLRRRGLADELTEFSSIRRVKTKEPSTHWQIRILGLFRKQGQTRFSEGFSRAALKINEGEMIKQAVDDARFKLGSTGWELVRIVEVEQMEYKLG